MRGQKVAVAILTIIEAIGLIGSICLMSFMAFVMGFGAAGGDWSLVAPILLSFLSIVAILLALGIIYLLLGIKFLSEKPNKAIAVTLIVINSFSVIGILFSIIAALGMSAVSAYNVFAVILGSLQGLILPVIKLVLLGLYLKKLGAQKNTFNMNPPQPVAGAYCESCGWKNEANDMYCKICGRQS